MRRSCSWLAVAIGALLLTATHAGFAQQPPPIPSVTGTLALEGIVDKTYVGTGTILVKASDGIGHLFHVTKRTLVHGVQPADEPFRGLEEGSRVVVHYAVDGADKTAVEVDRIGEDGLAEMQGVVTRVDRAARQLSIRLANGSTETLRLSERAAGYVGDGIDSFADHATVIVYYAEERGGKVAHYFKKVPAN